MKSISTLTNPTARYDAVILGNPSIEKAALGLFDRLTELNSYTKVDAPPGRISALDLIDISDANIETAVNLKETKETIKRLEERVASVVKDKVIAIMKEEAEISEASRFINEGKKEDPAFELKFKHLKKLSEKNTLFKEICRNIHTLNENVNTGSTDEYMAEALLQLTLMETLNTLYLENLTISERINKLQKERSAYLLQNRK